MSLTTATNISVLNSIVDGRANNAKLNASLQRLSSSLRINSYADDVGAAITSSSFTSFTSLTVSSSLVSITSSFTSSGKVTSTSGPEVSKSTFGFSCFILFSSGIVPSYVSICAGYLLDPVRLLIFHLH